MLSRPAVPISLPTLPCSVGRGCQPVVAPVTIGSIRARPVALSTIVLAAGFCLGALVFLRRGRRLFGVAHGIFGVAWAGVAVGTAARSGAIGLIYTWMVRMVGLS